RGRLEATWTNPHPTPTNRLVFNAHARHVVPAADVPLVAKTLELLRMQPSDSMGVTEPPLEIHSVTLIQPSGPARPLKFSYGGTTNTDLVVPLPCEVRRNESVTVVMDFTLTLPQKQGRWGQWEGVTFLSNWLPVFAVYDRPMRAPDTPESLGMAPG